MIRIFVTLFLLQAFGAPGVADWKIHPTTSDERRLLGPEVVAVLGSAQMNLMQINVTRLKIQHPIPATEPEWQDFVVAHMRLGKNHVALKRALLRSPSFAYIAEISYNMHGMPMLAKVLAMVRGDCILIFRYDDEPQTYARNNRAAYRGLFQELAFGKREGLIAQIPPL